MPEGTVHREGGRQLSGFPFSAVVGMDDLRLALVLNAVSPAIGGVLVRGEKGTAKSTMVRALAAVLPEVAAVTGCRFSCDPAAPDAGCPDGPHERQAPALARPARLVELPVGATEDRLVGALDIERALTEGVKAYEPGLLAAAHRGVLYVDEVNLLHDHLVDLLLDAAALDTCYVEREGVSVRHPARFLLVGTMNPEEGELRPQLLDRFGLTVEAAAPRDAGPRAEVIRRRLAYDADPAGFTAAWAEAENALAERIAAARQRLARVVLPDSALRQVASVCAAFGVDGLRADLVTARAALAHAAWAGRPEVTAADIRAAARLALPHRRRRQPFDAPGLPEDELDQALADAMDDDGPGDCPDDDGPGDGDGSAGDDRSGGDRSGRAGGAGDSTQPDSGQGRDRDPQRAGATAPGAHGDGAPGDGTAGPGTPPAGAPDGPLAQRQPRAGEHGTGEGAAELPAAAPGPVFRVRRLDVPGTGTGAPGRRSRSRSGTGRVTGAQRPNGRLTRLHLPATLAAAAPYQLARGRVGPSPGPKAHPPGQIHQPRDHGAPAGQDLPPRQDHQPPAREASRAQAPPPGQEPPPPQDHQPPAREPSRAQAPPPRQEPPPAQVPPPSQDHQPRAQAPQPGHAAQRPAQAGGPVLRLRRDDLREARLEGRESNLVLFVVDASGSMAARARMGAVKGAVLSLLLDAYQRRDKVGMVTFRGDGAQLLLPPTSSVETAATRLAALPAGGRSPLAAGLLRAHEVLRTERFRDPRRRPLLVVVTDGRATGGPEPLASAHRAAALLAATGVASVVVDCETGPLRLGLAAGLASSLGADLLAPEQLAAGPLADSVRAIREAA